MPPGVLSFEPDREWDLPAPALFGTKMRTALLMLVALLGESYPAELSRYLGTSIASVQRTLDKLEEEGIVASRPRGVRVVTLDPSYPAVNEMRTLLLRLVEGYPQYDELKKSRRARPRRRAKPL